MSNTSTFAVGLGSGLAFWYLTKNKSAPAAVATPNNSTLTSPPRNCAVRLGPTGLMVDGTRVDIAEAVRRCEAAGRAAVTVARNAPASTYASLMTALGATHRSGVRNAGKRKRGKPRVGRRNNDTWSTFTLAIYPNGIDGSNKRVRWFRSDSPTTWQDARDRLIAARFIDPSAVGPNTPGYWRLTTDVRTFKADRAETLPDDSSRPRDASRASQRYTHEGRTILRDGEAILHVERVDLGNERYAISPHHADLLTQRIVRLVNQHGAR